MIIVFYLLLFIMALMPSSKKSTKSTLNNEAKRFKQDTECKDHIVDIPAEKPPVKTLEKPPVKDKTPRFFEFSDEHEKLSKNGKDPLEKHRKP